jgi:RNA polymerase sigma factor (sigma-70 family)
MRSTNHAISLVTDASDAELVERSRRGDRDAFAALVERYQRLVLGVALAATGDAALAEDVAQDALVEAWRSLGGLRDPSRVGPWLAGIARNLAHGAARQRARRRPPAPEPDSSAAATPLDEVLARESERLLRDWLDTIPATHREAVLLYYVEGQSAAQVAAHLGVTEALVRQRLSRGRRALRADSSGRVEAWLEQVRPCASFGAVVLAALPPVGVPETAAASVAGKVVMAMSMKHALGAAALVVVLGGGWYAITSSAGPVSDEPPAAPPETAVPAGAEERGAASPSAGRPAARVTARRFADRAARERLAARIREQRSRRGPATPPATGSPGGPSAATAPEQLDRDYIRTAMQDIIPLVEECYVNALVTDPALAGRVTVEFTIEGEPEVGGLVGSSEVVDSDIDAPDMLECMRETMYALELEPPAEGTVVKVRYPFELSNVPREHSEKSGEPAGKTAPP